MATILYVDDEAAVGRVLEDALGRAGHVPLGAHTAPEALQRLAQGDVDLIIADYQMFGLTGPEFLALVQREGYGTPMIMLTGRASVEQAVASIRAGAVNYITKPVRPQQLEMAVNQALDLVRLRRENEAWARARIECRNEREIVGDSPAIRRLQQTVAMAAPTRATVLLQGESGTGKELFARAIHDQSDRRDGPFIRVNCAALAEGVIESALFGDERGAVTGAVSRVDGAFERANRGTLLLDEVSAMRLDLQAKLLRVLEEHEFERVGGTTPVRVDVRIIATTTRDLAAEAAAGTFRQDLYYRLSVIPVMIAPLRERPDDISALAHRFAMRTAAETGKTVKGISPEAMELLQRFPWPGNVRELQHAVERAVILSTEPVLGPHCFDGHQLGLTHALGSSLADSTRDALPSPMGGTQVLAGVGGGSLAVTLTSFNVDAAEAVLIQRALEASGQNRTRAAELLGISVRTLRNKLNGPAREAGEEHGAPRVLLATE